MQTFNYVGITKAGSKYFNSGGVWPYIYSTQVSSNVSYNNSYTSASLKLAAVGNIDSASLTVKGKFLYSQYGTLKSGVLTIPKLGTIKLSGLNLKVYEFNNYDFSDFQGGLKDKVIGSKYSDNYWGYENSDALYGNNGNDKLYGGNGNDKLYGGNDNDKLYGGYHNDKLYGENGNDLLVGGYGNDKLYGGNGNDNLYGGSNNDWLNGGFGKDKLIGGKGNDIFRLNTGKGYDLIQDFKNKQDKIFIGSIKKLKRKNKGKDVWIYSGKDLLAKVKKAKGLLSKKGKYLV